VLDIFDRTPALGWAAVPLENWRLGRIIDPFGLEWEIGTPLGRLHEERGPAHRINELLPPTDAHDSRDNRARQAVRPQITETANVCGLLKRCRKFG